MQTYSENVWDVIENIFIIDVSIDLELYENISKSRY